MDVVFTVTQVGGVKERRRRPYTASCRAVPKRTTTNKGGGVVVESAEIRVWAAAPPDAGVTRLVSRARGMREDFRQSPARHRGPHGPATGRWFGAERQTRM